MRGWPSSAERSLRDALSTHPSCLRCGGWGGRCGRLLPLPPLTSLLPTTASHIGSSEPLAPPPDSILFSHAPSFLPTPLSLQPLQEASPGPRAEPVPFAGSAHLFSSFDMDIFPASHGVE